MDQTTSKQIRILAIAPSARGFGYSVMEGDSILECGNKGAKGNKNVRAITKLEKLMKQFLPGVLVLPDVNAKGCHRAPRIKALHRQVIELATMQKCKVALFSGEQLRIALLGDVKGTKHEMAEMLAQKYPVELAAKLPPKRRAWENEDRRMDIFDAMAMAVVFGVDRTRKRPDTLGI
jgi:Holliday junction resolvasome RuvABC endonuclease subunit